MQSRWWIILSFIYLDIRINFKVKVGKSDLEILNPNAHPRVLLICADDWKICKLAS